MLKCLNEFTQLVNHTNRLFVYKAKLSPKGNKVNNFLQLSRKTDINRTLRNSKSDEILNKSKNIKKRKRFE